MFTAKIKNRYGETLELTHNPDYTVTNIDGLSAVAAAVNTAVMATADGAIFNSSRKNERNIVITVVIEGDVEKNRLRLYRYAPTKHPITFYFKNQNRDVFIDGYVESHECNLFENRQVSHISIICPNPFFKSVEDSRIQFSSVEALLEFELLIDSETGIEFSEIITENETNIYNDGDAETGIMIEMRAVGTVVDPVVYNRDTRDKFALRFTMQEADVIRINTNSGEKSVMLIRDGEEKNIINAVDMNNDWFTLRYGDNIFTYEAASGYEFLQLTINVSNKFEGV